MKVAKQYIPKLLLGALLLAIAAGVTMLIKESLDTQDPESALPIATVTCGDVQVTSVYRAGYDWSFFTTAERKEAPAVGTEDLPITPVDAKPGQPITISFSKKPSELRVWRAQGYGSDDYAELAGETPESFLGPTQPGLYVYRVLAKWTRGDILYYFALDIKP